MSNRKIRILGKCMDMCPLDEVKMREKEKLLHILEMVPGTERIKFPKANPKSMVKCFTRSAAGLALDKVENLRPPDVLLETINYLLFDVIHNDRLPFFKTYDFITDRLMAVRQDMVIQNIPEAESIAILEPIVRFHAYAAYRLSHDNLRNFDPVLNNNYLLETLKRLLCCYDYLDSVPEKYLFKSRSEFEALYVIFNLGNEEALRRAIDLPIKTAVIRTATELSLCYQYGNYVRLCQIMKKLPALLAAVASLFLPEIRRRAFEVMSIAYNSKNNTFPITTLKDILLYDSDQDLIQDCVYYNIKYDNLYIYFSRQSFNRSKSKVAAKQELFVEEKLMNAESIDKILLEN